MPGTVLNLETAKELNQLVTRFAAAAGETLGSLIARELALQPTEIALTSAPAVLGALKGPHAVVRGALDKAWAGHTLWALFELQDAIAMAALLMMTPDDVIEQRRA